MGFRLVRDVNTRWFFNSSRFSFSAMRVERKKFGDFLPSDLVVVATRVLQVPDDCYLLALYVKYQHIMSVMMHGTRDFWSEKISDWDADSLRCLAPLSAKQKDVLVELGAAALERPMPVSSPSRLFR